MKTASLLLLGLVLTFCACKKDEQIKLISDKAWSIGEARDCSVLREQT